MINLYSAALHEHTALEPAPWTRSLPAWFLAPLSHRQGVAMINITSFTHLHRTQTPTGVGVHIIEMLRELASRDQVNLQMLISAKETDSITSAREFFSKPSLVNT